MKVTRESNYILEISEYERGVLLKALEVAQDNITEDAPLYIESNSLYAALDNPGVKE